MQYNPDRINHRSILSPQDAAFLGKLSDAFGLDQFLADPRHFEEVTVDFVYTSAKIEGNTYDRLDTDNLLRRGITAGGKKYSDAVMLLNLREGFDLAMGSEPQTRIDEDYLCKVHKVLMRDLLPIHEQGIVRTTAVTIGATTYRPPADPIRLKQEMKALFSENGHFANPFERAIHLHCNLAYLQFFRDGNKRTARMMQTAALVQGGVLPLFFRDTLIDRYQRATVHYYDTGQYEPYIEFFKENHVLVIADLLGVNAQQLLNRLRAEVASEEVENRDRRSPGEADSRQGG